MDLRAQLLEVIREPTVVDSIVNWEDATREARMAVRQSLRRLDFNDLGDLRQEMLRIKDGLREPDRYWPLHYVNRLASHFYEIEAIDVAERAADAAEQSLGTATASANAAKRSATAAETAIRTAERSASATEQSARISLAALVVAVLALLVTTAPLIRNTFWPSKNELTTSEMLRLVPDRKEVQIAVDEWLSQREQQLLNRIALLETQLAELSSAGTRSTPSVPPE